MVKTKQFTLDLADRQLIVETGLLAGQASGSVTVRYGDTVVLATATMSENKAKHLDYFPLMVDYEEKYYASGKIKGSRFIKREGRPSDDAILTARLIDRTIRPLFDERMRNEVQVVVTVLSIDQENDPDVVAIIAASLALGLSFIPWGGPVAAVRVGKIENDFVVNPKVELFPNSQVDIVISGTDGKINMIEAGAKELPNDAMIQSIQTGFDVIKKIVAFEKEIIAQAGKEKSVVELTSPSDEFKQTIRELLANEGLEEAFYTKDKKEQRAKMSAIKENLLAMIKTDFPVEEFDARKAEADLVYENELNDILHRRILEKDERPDGRKLDEVRLITSRVGLLPRTHGSGLFSRGETQVLTVATLGAPGAEQLIGRRDITVLRGWWQYPCPYNRPTLLKQQVFATRGDQHLARLHQIPVYRLADLKMGAAV